MKALTPFSGNKMISLTDRKVMLDSGAFSVWNQNHKYRDAPEKQITIDLDEYIEYCQQHPGFFSYVNLDVIPGEPNRREGRYLYEGFFTNSDLPHREVEKACEQSYDNYRRMIKKLPIEKVIPVFHQDDDVKWLKKYLRLGCEYIGISPANDRTVKQKLRWLKEIYPVVCKSGTKRLKVKTHGFAVTSHKIITEWPWYSVDSATWIRESAYGNIFVPGRGKGGEPDYNRPHHIISVTPRPPETGAPRPHLSGLTKEIKEYVEGYIRRRGFALGKFKVEDVGKDAKLRRGEQLWYNQAEGKAVTILKRGLSTCMGQRRQINAMYWADKAKHADVQELFLAGVVEDETIDKVSRNRLLSYLYLCENKRRQKVLQSLGVV